MSGLMRHWHALRGLDMPRQDRPFHLDKACVGWVTAESADLLPGYGCIRTGNGVMLRKPTDLPALARRLAEDGIVTWRGEPFDVRAAPGDEVLATVDRGALAFFGIIAQGVHVNGLVRRIDGLHLWVARRAADRLMDPGKLDHIVAGGIPAGLTREQTLVKEAAEEAGLGEAIMRQAHYTGIVSYTASRPEGLRRDVLHCYDLELPEQMRPIPADGEVAGFELWPIERVVETVRATCAFKFNVNLVLIALFLRLGVLPAAEAASLRDPHED